LQDTYSFSESDSWDECVNQISDKRHCVLFGDGCMVFTILQIQITCNYVTPNVIVWLRTVKPLQYGGVRSCLRQYGLACVSLGPVSLMNSSSLQISNCAALIGCESKVKSQSKARKASTRRGSSFNLNFATDIRASGRGEVESGRVERDMGYGVATTGNSAVISNAVGSLQGGAVSGKRETGSIQLLLGTGPMLSSSLICSVTFCSVMLRFDWTAVSRWLVVGSTRIS
jgi:hypothetical protein